MAGTYHVGDLRNYIESFFVHLSYCQMSKRLAMRFEWVNTDEEPRTLSGKCYMEYKHNVNNFHLSLFVCLWQYYFRYQMELSYHVCFLSWFYSIQIKFLFKSHCLTLKKCFNSFHFVHVKCSLGFNLSLTSLPTYSNLKSQLYNGNLQI